MSTNPVDTPLPMGNLKLTVKDYLKKIEMHNDFLQGLIQTMLTQLASTQHITLAQVKVSMQWEAKVASEGDKTKDDEALIEINKLVGEQL